MNPEVEWLAKVGVITIGNKDAEVFSFLLEALSIYDYDKPSELISALWQKYESYPNQTNSLNGRIFEAILATAFLKQEISPIFIQAKVVFVPNVNFDFILYSKGQGPVSISAKTSLRERYKQADLEAISLKYVHRKSQSFLITLNEEEAKSVAGKIKKGDLLGIDRVIVASVPEFDDFVKELQTLELIEPDKIAVIEAAKVLKPLD